MTITVPQSPGETFERGDVVLVLYPNSNLRTAKTRPALVIQRDDLQSGLSQMIVCMITSREFRSTIATSEIDRAIGALPMADIDLALRHTLAL